MRPTLAPARHGATPLETRHRLLESADAVASPPMETQDITLKFKLMEAFSTPKLIANAGGGIIIASEQELQDYT